MTHKDSENNILSAFPATIKAFGCDNFNLSTLFPDVGDSSTLVVATRPDNYSASILARAVEDCDAHLLNLNVGAKTDDGERILIYLRVNHRNGEGVARSLERFGYEVLAIDSDNADESITDEARSRINELMRYLEI